MHNQIRINHFRSKHDNAVKSLGEVTWDDLCQFLSQHASYTRKEDVPLFNLVRYREIKDTTTPDPNVGVDDETLDFVRLRRRANLVRVDALVLDYDGGITIDEAKERFGKYEYFGYTSYNHLKDGKTEKFRLIFPLCKPITVANREEPSPGASPTYELLTESISSFAGPCDPVVRNPNQHFYIPATHPSRLTKAFSWRNKGAVVDWTQWRAASPSPTSRSSLSPGLQTGHGSQHLEPDIEFVLARGRRLLAKDVKGYTKKVLCPFHPDKKPTEFLNRFEDSGLIVFHCKKCGTFVLPPERLTRDKPTTSAEPEWVAPIQADQRKAVLDRFFVSDFLYQDAPNRDEVKAALDRIKVLITSDSPEVIVRPKPPALSRVQYVGYKSHLILMPEGAGKSALALDLVLSEPADAMVSVTERDEEGDTRKRVVPVKRPYRVLFACRSWSQVFEKFEQWSPYLEKHGLSAQIAYSVDGRLQRRFGIRPVRKTSRPFRTGKIQAEPTLERIYQHVGVGTEREQFSREFVDVYWNLITSSTSPDGSDEPRFADLCRYDDTPVDPEDRRAIYGWKHDTTGQESGLGPSIVFTTFARLRLLSVLFDRIPEDWIVWIDDPDLDDVLDIAPVPKNALRKNIDDSRALVNGTEYYIREQEKRLGYAFRKSHRCIYTTTESLVAHFIKKTCHERGERLVEHDFVNAVEGGRITILGTRCVQKKLDALVPLFTQRLRKKRPLGGKREVPLVLIADGLSAEFNHSTVKGRNDLSGADLIVELSKPHPSLIRTVNDALNQKFDEKGQELIKTLTLDRLHQAIGRNSGFRTAGRECVVLVDPNDHKFLVENCRYLGLDYQNSLMIDRTQQTLRGQKKLPKDASPLAIALENLIHDPYKYVLDNRKVRPDIDHVVNTIDQVEKRLSYLIRLLHALTTLSNVRFGEGSFRPKTRTDQKFYDLGNWVLDEFVPKGSRDSLIFDYLATLNEPRTSSVL